GSAGSVPLCVGRFARARPRELLLTAATAGGARRLLWRATAPGKVGSTLRCKGATWVLQRWGRSMPPQFLAVFSLLAQSSGAETGLEVVCVGAPGQCGVDEGDVEFDSPDHSEDGEEEEEEAADCDSDEDDAPDEVGDEVEGDEMQQQQQEQQQEQQQPEQQPQEQQQQQQHHQQQEHEQEEEEQQQPVLEQDIERVGPASAAFALTANNDSSNSHNNSSNNDNHNSNNSNNNSNNNNNSNSSGTQLKDVPARDLSLSPACSSDLSPIGGLSRKERSVSLGSVTHDTDTAEATEEDAESLASRPACQQYATMGICFEGAQCAFQHPAGAEVVRAEGCPFRSEVRERCPLRWYCAFTHGEAERQCPPIFRARSA
ncbi:unnamed protein product, partial [Polarella glacialis]